MRRQIHKPILFTGMAAVFGIVQFAAAVTLAMNVSEDYAMTGQFLSDLGRADNAEAAPIFNRGVVILGVLLIPFFLVMPRVLQRFRNLIRVAGVVSACGLIGIGLTPYDQFFVAHQLCLAMWVAPMLLLMVTFFVAAVLDGFATRWLTIGTIVCLIAIFGYITAGSHQGHVVLQKAVAVLAIWWFAMVFLTVVVTTVGSITLRREIVERQAQSYLRMIKHNHRRG